jgi:hypothetical protein
MIPFSTRICPRVLTPPDFDLISIPASRFFVTHSVVGMREWTAPIVVEQ